MCSAKKATQAFRAAADVYTFGAYEGYRKFKVTKPFVQGAESAVNKVAGGSGQTADGLFPWDDKAPAGAPAPENPTPMTEEPAPTFQPPTPSETAAMLRKRRLAALRAGIASTIKTSGQGATGLVSLLTPSAAGTSGGKTLLGA